MPDRAATLAEAARLRSLAERYAPGRVRFEGAVPNERIGALFNAACSASTTLSVTVNHLGRFQAAGLVCLELFFAQGSPLSWLSVMVVAGVLLSASLLEAAARWRKLSAFISRIAA